MINRIKAKPYGTAKQGRSQGKLWLILYVWGFILEHFFHINYFHWTLLHLKFDQRTHSLINIVFLTSCLTFLITSTDIEGRRIYLKNWVTRVGIHHRSSTTRPKLGTSCLNLSVNRPGTKWPCVRNDWTTYRIVKLVSREFYRFFFTRLLRYYLVHLEEILRSCDSLKKIQRFVSCNFSPRTP